MPRFYLVTFEQVAVTAAQDLVQITGATGKIYRIRRRWVGCTDTTIPTAQMISLRERFFTATVTVGSGGTTGITPTRRDVGDAVCSTTTCATNNTTKATTSGTGSIINEIGVHIYNGYDEPWLDAPMGVPPFVGPSEAYVFELLSTVTGTVHLSGGVEIEEMGG